MVQSRGLGLFDWPGATAAVIISVQVPSVTDIQHNARKKKKLEGGQY